MGDPAPGIQEFRSSAIVLLIKTYTIFLLDQQ